MDSSIVNALWLMQRQSSLKAAMRAKGGFRVADKQELLAVESRLQRYPEAVKAILSTSNHLNRPIDALSAADVLRSA